MSNRVKIFLIVGMWMAAIGLTEFHDSVRWGWVVLAVVSTYRTLNQTSR